MNNEGKKAITQSISACPIWPMLATEKIGQMIGEISQANSVMGNISATVQNNAIKGGFAAETFHAESFNLDAILKDRRRINQWIARFRRGLIACRAVKDKVFD